MPTTPTRPLLPGTFLMQPGHGVVGVGALVDCFGVVVIGERPHHHKFALALVAAANVFAHVDVAVAGQFRALRKEPGAGGVVHAIGRALHQDRQRRGDVCGLENHRVELDPVAHGNHDLGAHVVVEDVMDGRAGAAEEGTGCVGKRNSCAAPRGIQSEGDGGV